MRGLILWTVALLSVSSAALAAEPPSAAKPAAGDDGKGPNAAASAGASGAQVTLTSALVGGVNIGAAKPNCLTLVSTPERFRSCMREARTVLRHPTPRQPERRSWLNPSGWLPGS